MIEFTGRTRQQTLSVLITRRSGFAPVQRLVRRIQTVFPLFLTCHSLHKTDRNTTRLYVSIHSNVIIATTPHMFDLAMEILQFPHNHHMSTATMIQSFIYLPPNGRRNRREKALAHLPRCRLARRAFLRPVDAVVSSLNCHKHLTLKTGKI